MKKILYFIPLLLLCACQENPDYGESAIPVVRIVEDSLTVMVNETKRLTLSTEISGVQWSSLSDSIATVNYQGKVTGRREGQTTISAQRLTSLSSCIVTVIADTTKHD